MKKPANPSLHRHILEEASEWFVDFRVGDVDADAGQRFDEWLRRSPDHIRAYWEIAKTYVELPPANSLDKLKADELIAYARSDANANVISLHSSAKPSPPMRDEPAHADTPTRGGRPPPRFRRSFLAAASVASVFVMAGAVYWQAHRYPLYTTDIGERRSITLADGSTVDLNARSSIRIEFSPNERHVELLSGQALFQVAKDKHHPFIVRSGEATVRAVGTQFDVYRKEGGTTVTVLEGRVAVYSTIHSAEPSSPESSATATPDVTPPPPVAKTHAAPPNHAPGSVTDILSLPAGLGDPSGSAAVFVSAGEQVTVTPGAIVPAAHPDLTAATAWTQRKLIFDGSKLSDVASEFNRYNRRQILIDSRAFADFHVSGVYSSTDPASLIRFLRDQPGVKITETDNDIRIQAQ